MTVVIKDDVTVSSVELSICGWIHGHLVRRLNTPDLSRNKQGQIPVRKRRDYVKHAPPTGWERISSS